MPTTISTSQTKSQNLANG